MRCRLPKQRMTWTEPADSNMNQDEVTIAILRASKELIEDQERQIEELKAKLAIFGCCAK